MPSLCLLSAGSNAQGQLATGDLEDAHRFSPCLFIDSPPSIPPSSTHKILRIACGANHTLALFERVEGSSHTWTELWGCGDGSRGQLGPLYTDDPNNSSSSSVVFRPLNLDLRRYGLDDYSIRSIAAAWETSYVVLCCPDKDDVVLSMGADDFGDLGVGGTRGKQGPDPAHVVDFSHLDYPDRNRAHSLRIDSLVAGPHLVVVQLKVLLRGGSIIGLTAGWGTSRHGQLGDIKASGRPVPFVSSPHLIPIGGAEHIVSCAVGAQHSVFLRSSGSVFGLGSNRKGQLQDIHLWKNVSMIGCTWNGTYAVVEDGDTWSICATGDNGKGQLGHLWSPGAAEGAPPYTVLFQFSSLTHKPIKLVCGSEHVLCLFMKQSTDLASGSETEVWGWGWNEHGNLGTGTTEDVYAPIRLWPTAQNDWRGRVLDAWAGCGTSWLVLDT